mgnify:FL=1
MPDRVLKHHLERRRLAGLEAVGVGSAHGEEERDGVHAFGRQRHGFLLIGFLAAAPAGEDLIVLPVVAVVALERIVAFVQVAFETYGALCLRVDPYRVDVFEVEEPAVGGQRAADALDLVVFAAGDFAVAGLDLHGADLGVREHLGLVAHAVEELLARMVELGREGQDGRKE